MINGFDDIQRAGMENMNRALQGFNVLSRGWQSLASETAGFSKESLEEGAAHLEKLSGAKSLDAALAAQAEYLRASYEKAVGQAARVGELYMDLVKEATRSVDGGWTAAK